MSGNTCLQLMEGSFKLYFHILSLCQNWVISQGYYPVNNLLNNLSYIITAGLVQDMQIYTSKSGRQTFSIMEQMASIFF
jgi:hypothetical protein